MKFSACMFCCPHSLRKKFTLQCKTSGFSPFSNGSDKGAVGLMALAYVYEIKSMSWIFISLICSSLRLNTFFSSLACQVGLLSLNLGICPKLNILSIEAPSMVSLELKGCGILSEAFINCPLLKSLDASFCRLCCICYFLRYPPCMPDWQLMFFGITAN